MKNLPQTGEPILSKISEELWTRIDNMPKTEPEEIKTIQALLEKYHFYWLSRMKWKDFLSYHNSLRSKPFKYQVRTGSFSRYTPIRISEIQEELDIEEKEYLIDGKRNRKIKTPILTGWTYILKLHHVSEYPNKITGNNERDPNPLALGLGMTRKTGQIIGEFESMSLISHGVNDYLKDVRGNTKSDWFGIKANLKFQLIAGNSLEFKLLKVNITVY